MYIYMYMHIQDAKNPHLCVCMYISAYTYITKLEHRSAVPPMSLKPFDAGSQVRTASSKPAAWSSTRDRQDWREYISIYGYIYICIFVYICICKNTMQEERNIDIDK